MINPKNNKMTILKRTCAAFCMIFATYASQAQTVTVTQGGQTKFVQKKNSETMNFTTGGNSAFVTSYFEQAMTKYYVEGFGGNGTAQAQRELEVSPGVFNNSYGIDEVVALGGKMYALVEHLDKPAGKNTLTARLIETSGAVSKDETELMSFAFEKTMNSGFNYSVASEDQSKLAIVALLPYEKEMSAKLKISVYDKDLKKISSSDVTFPGEDTKNKNLKVAVANDGTVYIIKQTSMKNGEMILTVYQHSGTADLKEYTFELTAPNYFTNYAYSTTSAGELVIAGTYYERKTVTTGDRKISGIFYFTNKGKSEKVFKSFPLDAPVENLTARKVLINGNTIFLAAQQYKEEKINPPSAAAASAASYDYSYNYTYKNEYVIAMDADGNKKFELTMQRDLQARDFDKQFLSAYHIVNGKFTMIYNDQTKKYTENSGYSYLVPVLVQITNDGLMQSPVVFIDKLKLHDYQVIYPAYSVQKSANEISLLTRSGELSQLVTLKID